MSKDETAVVTLNEKLYTACVSKRERMEKCQASFDSAKEDLKDAKKSLDDATASFTEAFDALYKDASGEMPLFAHQSEVEQAPAEKCDGQHAEQVCGDPECWQLVGVEPPAQPMADPGDVMASSMPDPNDPPF